MNLVLRHILNLSVPRLYRYKLPASKQLCTTVAKDVSIRPMTPEEALQVLPCAAREGSSPSPYECQTITQCNPDGLFVAESSAGILGSISAMKYSPKLGHVGFYHIEPQYRGEGVGQALWKKAVQYLGNDCNIGIDVPSDRTEVFKKLGFQVAWTNCRYRGIGMSLLPEVIDTTHIRSLARLSLAPLVDFDAEVCTVERRRFVQRWANTPKPGGAYAIIREGDILGYGVIRPSIEGHLIGPLYALNTAITQPLLLTLFSKVANKTVYVDAPQDNPSFIQLLSVDLRMEPVFESVRMYSMGDPGVLLQKVFAVSSIETG